MGVSMTPKEQDKEAEQESKAGLAPPVITTGASFRRFDVTVRAWVVGLDGVEGDDAEIIEGPATKLHPTIGGELKAKLNLITLDCVRDIHIVEPPLFILVVDFPTITGVVILPHLVLVGVDCGLIVKPVFDVQPASVLKPNMLVALGIDHGTL